MLGACVERTRSTRGAAAERAPHCATIVRRAGIFPPAVAAGHAPTLSAMDLDTLCNWLALLTLLALGILW
jgi:hypothetical protein